MPGRWRQIVGFLSVVACASAAPAHAEDPAARLQLMGAAFANAPPPPRPGRTTASAFLPGRGVITWDVTGLNAEQAREAEIEAMGLADARAVQREIDAENAKRQAEAPSVAAPAPVFVLARDGPAASARAPRDARDKGLGARALGVNPGESLKSQPRLYAFAAASGSGIGLNVLHDAAGWRNAGLTTDRGGFAGQRQAGIAWRKGRVQTSLSYVSQKSRGILLGMESDKDHRVMLTTAMPTETLVGLITGH